MYIANYNNIENYNNCCNSYRRYIVQPVRVGHLGAECE